MKDSLIRNSGADRTMSAILLGVLSILCCLYWGNYTLAYLDAAPIALLGAIVAGWGLFRGHQSAKDFHIIAEKRIAQVGMFLCILGIFANVGLFLLALIDL